jgi:GLPGLI family protein
MMRISIIFSFLLLLLYAETPHNKHFDELQEGNIEIIYNAILKDFAYINDNPPPPGFRTFMDDLDRKRQQMILDIDFKLLASNEEYLLTFESPILSDDYDSYTLTGAVSRAIDGSVIYADLTDGVSYLGGFETGDPIDRRFSVDDVEWTLFEGDEKVILGKRCFKAIGRLKSNDLAHAPLYPVIAWYAPELNIRGGPIQFATLPGAILKLETQTAVLTAVSVKKTNEKIKKFIPKKNVKTHPEYLKYYEEWNRINRPRPGQ